MYIPSPDYIRRATGQRPGPNSLPTLHSWFTYYNRQHISYLCRWYCRPNYKRRTCNSNTQTTNTFKQNPITVEKKWMKANETKSVQLTFTLKKNTCPPVQLNNKHLTQTEEVKYIDIHLDQKLIWRKHISLKRKQLDLKQCKLYWIIDRKS